MYGPPDEIDNHRNGDATKPYPWETWKYRITSNKIPAIVVFDFVDPDRTGEYRRQDWRVSAATDPNAANAH